MLQHELFYSLEYTDFKKIETGHLFFMFIHGTMGPLISISVRGVGSSSWWANFCTYGRNRFLRGLPSNYIVSLNKT
jgi:hypothetical protein